MFAAIKNRLLSVGLLVAGTAFASASAPANNNQAKPTTKAPAVSAKASNQAYVVKYKDPTTGKRFAFDLNSKTGQEAYAKFKKSPKFIDMVGDDSPTGVGNAPIRAVTNNAASEAARKAAVIKAQEEARQAENLKRVEEQRKADAFKQAEEQKIADAQKQAEALKLAEQQKQADALKQAEEQKIADAQKAEAEKKQIEALKLVEVQKEETANKQAAAPAQTVDSSGNLNISGFIGAEGWLYSNANIPFGIGAPISVVELTAGKFTYYEQRFLTTDEYIQAGRLRVNHLTYRFGDGSNLSSIRVGAFEQNKQDTSYGDPFSFWNNIQYRRVVDGIEVDLRDANKPEQIKLAGFVDTSMGEKRQGVQATFGTGWTSGGNSTGWAQAMASTAQGGSTYIFAEQKQGNVILNADLGANRFGTGRTLTGSYYDHASGVGTGLTWHNFKYTNGGNQQKANDVNLSVYLRRKGYFNSNRDLSYFFTGGYSYGLGSNPNMKGSNYLLSGGVTLQFGKKTSSDGAKKVTWIAPEVK